MTKEEAIIILKCIKAENLNLDNVYIKDRHDALNVAIEMLDKKVSEPWCEGCKEHDEERHCCHRYSNVIRQTLNDNINAVLEDIKDEVRKQFVNFGTEEKRSVNETVFNILAIIDKYMRKENE